MNKVFLIGNLTRDPEMRTTPSGVAVCTFSIAVNRRYAKDKQEKEADYFNVVAWRSLGELCGKYLAKGRKVSVVGELQNRSYDDKEGVKRYVTEIEALRVAGYRVEACKGFEEARKIIEGYLREER